MVNIEQSKSQVVQIDTNLINSKSENEKKRTLSKLSSTVNFLSILPNTDLQYIVEPEGIKENIIVNQRIDNPVYKFNISTKNLTAKLQDDKSIIFYDISDSSKQIFRIDKPFMYDKNGEQSEDINITLENNKKEYTLTLTPDNNWLSSADRIYPVTIDPQVSTSLDKANIHDAHVTETYPTTNYELSYMLKTGVGRHRTYVKFDLPALSAGDMVIGAMFNSTLLSSNPDYRQVDVHKVLADWNDSTITWNNMPAYNTTKIEDYQNVKDMNILYSWNVTGIVKDWYETGNNYGLMLKNNNESVGYVEYYSTDTNLAYQQFRPQVTISYLNNSGLEGYWTYHSQNIGRAGTAYVNDYNGNLIYTHNDLAMNGNKLPIALNHVYNTNEWGKGVGYGIGWRLNLYQELALVNIDNTQYYMYTDEDGTKHYFIYDSALGKYKDESGLDLTMVKNADGTYTITDKGGNKLNFTTSGYLFKVQDNNSNTMNLTYTNGRITSITDGAGRVTKLEYNADKTLLLSITDPSDRITKYDYTGTYLTKITYPDNKVTTIGYDANNRLSSVTSPDGYKMVYSYTTGQPYRVNKVQETHRDGTLGQTMDITYGYNATTFKDSLGRKNTYIFNYFGNTTSIKDEDGSAEYYKYIADGGNRNKLSGSSKLQKSILSYLKNHSGEATTDWLGSYYTGSTGSTAFDGAQEYMGNQSLRVIKTNNVSRQYYGQTLSLEKGKTYTFSSYVKTSNVSNANGGGAGLFVLYQNSAGVWQTISTSEHINGNQDWQRMELSFTIPADAAATTVYARAGLLSESGTAWFDALQLEDGTIANRYNLVENPSLTNGTDTPTSWTKNSNTDVNDTLIKETIPSATLDGSSFRINGDAAKQKNLYQVINVSGLKNDVFSVGGWAKGNSVPLAAGRYFAIDVGLQKLDGTFDWYVVPFNEDSSEWQYVSDKIVAKNDYKAAYFYVIYYNNLNSVYFDNLQLYKEEFEESYQYDTKGNVISTKDLADQESKFEYNGNNDLTKVISPKGSSFTYNYDTNNHNLLNATAAQNVVYSFTYDKYGNPLTSKVGDAALFLQSEAKYNTNPNDENDISNGNYVTELKDPYGNAVKYNYNLTKGTLDSLTDPKGKTTSYVYDPNLDSLLSVSKEVDGKTITNSYTYENDAIKTITHNGFSYTFNYDSLGNVKSVSVGTQNLISNNYDLKTGRLLESAYGNGQKISSDYDNLDRVTADKYEGEVRYKYQYDGAGNLGFHEDLVNGVNYRYVYDLSDRLVKVTDTKGNTLSYGYDKDNNVDKVTEKIGTSSYATGYEFDKDNRIIKLMIPNSSNYISYAYDSIGRVKTSTIVIGASQFVTTNNYDAGGKLQSVNLPGSRNISYTYDANGNIETITEAGKTIKYYYNELSELIREDNQVLDKTIAYSYDAGGNILSKIDYAYTSDVTLSNPVKTISYTYGDANWKDKLTAYNGMPIKYDAIGNPTEYGIYKYNWEGRQLKSMEPVTPGQAPVISFKYNSGGIRTEKQAGNVVTKYHLVGDKVTFEENGTDKIYYTYGNDGNLVSMNLNGVEYYYVRNAQGDIIGLLDGSGAEVVSYVYDSWGKLVSTAGALKDTVGAKNPYRYRGYRYDRETGYYYLNSRYYNPNWGRFLNIDLILGEMGHLLTHNLFVYSVNNPINMEDQDGKFAFVLAIFIPVAIKIIMGVVTAAAIVYTGYIVDTYIKQEIRKSSNISNTDTKKQKTKSKSKIDVKGKKGWVPKALPKDSEIGKKLPSSDMEKREILDSSRNKIGELHRGQPEYKYNPNGTKTPTGKEYPDHYHMPPGSKTHYIP